MSLFLVWDFGLSKFDDRLNALSAKVDITFSEGFGHFQCCCDVRKLSRFSQPSLGRDGSFFFHTSRQGVTRSLYTQHYHYQEISRTTYENALKHKVVLSLRSVKIYSIFALASGPSRFIIENFKTAQKHPQLNTHSFSREHGLCKNKSMHFTATECQQCRIKPNRSQNKVPSQSRHSASSLHHSPSGHE